MGIDCDSRLVYGWVVDYDKLRAHCSVYVNADTEMERQEDISQMLLEGFKINAHGDPVPHTSPDTIAAVREASPYFDSGMDKCIWFVNLITDDELSVYLSELAAIPEVVVEAAKQFAQSMTSKELGPPKIYSVKHIW